MSGESRRAHLPAYAKINLSLKVLDKRPDGFHELRTVFQTVSLADRVELAYTPHRRTVIEVHSEPEIPDNIAARAAESFFARRGVRGRLSIRIGKRIPMGGGLGGGSSDAAAVLGALPYLTGRRTPMETLTELAAGLGSDVPFFLHGGTALGLGRGTELYELPPARAAHCLLVFPPVAVRTPEAYAAMGRGAPGSLTMTDLLLTMGKFQTLVDSLTASRRLGYSGPGFPRRTSWRDFCENDFEDVVFRKHPLLGRLQRKLLSTGAKPARMTGSGSALFGIYDTRDAILRASSAFEEGTTQIVRFISREQRNLGWRRSLAAYSGG